MLVLSKQLRVVPDIELALRLICHVVLLARSVVMKDVLITLELRLSYWSSATKYRTYQVF